MRPLHHIAWTAVLLGFFIATDDVSAQSTCLCADGTLRYRPNSLGMPRFGGPPKCPSFICNNGTSSQPQLQFPDIGVFSNPGGLGVPSQPSRRFDVNSGLKAYRDAFRAGRAERRAREEHEISMERQRQEILILQQQNEILERQRQELIILRQQQNRQAVPADAGPYEDGLAAVNRGDFATALKIWKPPAEQGHAWAQSNLGIIYRDGLGVPQDYAEAVKWFRKAAEQGLANAQFNLGNMHANGEGVSQNFAQAKVWFDLAAAQGHRGAKQLQNSRAEPVQNSRTEPVQKYKVFPNGVFLRVD